MKIGELSTLSGVPIDTIRYYERQGLLPPPPERAEAVLLPALLAPQNTVAAVLVAPMVIVCMVEPGSLRPDSRPEIPAGWVLPTSPPLMPSLLNLPPPPRPC